MKTRKQKRQLILFALTAASLACAVASPFVVASCGGFAQRSPQDVAAAVERLRAMSRGGVLPADTVLAEIDKDYAGTKAGALARLLRARTRLEAGDGPGAAALLQDVKLLREQTSLGDYALLLRAQAFEKAGRRAEARASYEQLARDFSASPRAREATLRAAELMFQDGQASGVPVALKSLAERDDPAALLLTAKAHEQTGDSTRALAAYRRLYFYAPAAPEAKDLEAALARLNSTTAPATVEEATARAEQLFAAKRHHDAYQAYTDLFARFPNTATAPAQLRRGTAASLARRTPEAVAALSTIPASAADTRAESLYQLSQLHARNRTWDQARAVTEEMRRAYPKSVWTMRALVGAGQIAKESKHTPEAFNFYRAAVAAFPGGPEVAGAQFELAWAAHEAKNFQESSRLLVEHLAEYAGENTDNRGRAGYWAARDSERAGRAAEARALYEAMQARYDANWYGHLARQRLEAMDRNGVRPANNFAPDSLVARAARNLKHVTVAEETGGPGAADRARRADELNAVGLDAWAHAELDEALKSTPSSPRLNLAKARLLRFAGDNVAAFNVLRRSYPDYSQMKPEEMSREAWDVFYPLAFWDVIVQESRARSLDPYTVAGLIRQESVFDPRAASHANAYGLMQLLVPTGRIVAQRYGVGRPVTVESLFEPRLNIQLGTGYLRDNLNRFGKIEYVAAAYNAGPHRVERWLDELPAELDEWAEAIPFRETRGYVQGVVRNTLQYRRLYDERGQFRPEVGSRAVTGEPAAQPAEGTGVRVRRLGEDEDEEE